MKRIGKALIYLVFISLIAQGCSEEEPPPPHVIVGTWSLDGFIFGVVPTGFQNGWEGLFLTTGDLFTDIDSYEIEFMNDNTYSRTLSFPGPNVTDVGIWEIFESDLTLDPDDEPVDDEYEIVGEIEETEMTLSQSATFRLLPDAVTDTLTTYTTGDSDRLDAVWDEYGEAVTIDLWHLFER